MNWDNYLSSFVDGERVIAIDGMPAPAAPDSSHPGEHLCVNCHYPDAVVRANFREPLLDMAREDVVQLLRCLVASRRLTGLVSVQLTVIGHVEVEGADRPARRRVYRYCILCSALPDDPAQIDDEFLRDAPDTLVSSEIDDIAQILQHERQIADQK